MKDADDAIFNARLKDATMKEKTFEIGVFVTSRPSHYTQWLKPYKINDIAYWGTHQEDIAQCADKCTAPWLYCSIGSMQSTQEINFSI